MLALCRYDLSPPLALALGLTGHSPLHVLRDLHVLDLDNAYLHPPRVGLLIDYGLQLFVYGLPVGQELIEVLLSKDAPQGGLGDLAGCKDVVFDLDDAPVWVCDPEVDYGVDPGGDVIAGYDVLGRDVHGHGPQVYLDHPVDQRKEDEQPRTLWPPLDPPLASARGTS